MMTRTAIRILIGLLLSVLFYDSFVSGTLDISEAYLTTDADSDEFTEEYLPDPDLSTLAITLPYHLVRANQANGGLYRFDFMAASKWMDYFRPVQVRTYGCLLDLYINGIAVEMPPPNKGSCVQQFLISDDPAYVKGGWNEIGISVDSTLSNGLELFAERASWLSPPVTSLLIVLCAYFFTRSFIRRKEYFAEFNYKWLVVFLFTMPFIFMSTTIFSVRTWSHFFGTAIGAVTCMILLAQCGRVTGILGVTNIILRFFRRLPPKLLVTVSAVIFFASAAALSIHLFNGLPHVADTHLQYVHSKIMASGSFYVPSHKYRNFFDFQFISNNGKFYSNYPPGHIFLLTIGQWLGAPWLINPFLGALTIVALYMLTREIAGKNTAYIAIFLALISPFMMFMSSEYMNHATTLLCLTMFLYSYIRFDKTRLARFAFLSAVFVGYATITRPQSAVPYMVPVAIHALWKIRHDYRAHWKTLLAIALLAAGFIGLTMYYSYLTYGNMWHVLFGKQLYYVNRFLHRLGEGMFMEEFNRTTAQMRQLHYHLFGWPGTSLLFVGVLFLFRLQPAYGNMMVMCCFALAAALMVNPFKDGIFGPRYLYESISCLIPLTALCIARLPELLKKLVPHIRLSALRAGVALIVAMQTLLALMAMDNYLYNNYKDNYWEGNYAYYRLIEDNVEKPALVFMRHYGEYRLMYFTMPPDDTNDIIFALSLGEDNAALMDYYPDRAAYIVSDEKISRIR